jgi:hypothetical protein
MASTNSSCRVVSPPFPDAFGAHQSDMSPVISALTVEVSGDDKDDDPRLPLPLLLLTMPMLPTSWPSLRMHVILGGLHGLSSGYSA